MKFVKQHKGGHTITEGQVGTRCLAAEVLQKDNVDGRKAVNATTERHLQPIAKGQPVPPAEVGGQDVSLAAGRAP